MSTGGRWDEDIEWSPSGRSEPAPGPSPSSGETPTEPGGRPSSERRPRAGTSRRPSQPPPRRASPGALIAATAVGAFVLGGIVGYVLRGNPPVPDPATLQQTVPVVTVTVPEGDTP